MTTYVPLAQSARALLPDSTLIGPIDPKETASITVRVRAGSDGGTDLAAKAYELGNTPLSQRSYLTHEELKARSGADPAQLDAIEQYAQTHNLTVVHRNAAEKAIALRGTLGDLTAAFPTDLQMYHHATGVYRGRRGTINVPQALAPYVTGVFGFDTRPKQRSQSLLKGIAMSGPGGQNGFPATHFATRYNFPSQYGNIVALDGSGQTIAIIELGGGFRVSDLQTYFSEINSPMPDVSSVSVDYAGNNPTNSDSDDGEVMLDIEVLGSVVPKAKIVVYFAPNNGDQGLLDAISAAVHDSERKPSVVSISWGGPETFLDAQAIAAYHEVFASAAVLGITVCAASGDHGTADMDAGHWDQAIHVDHPASDDLVLGCGGSQIDPATNLDVAWNDGTPFNINAPGGGGWAGGGGISAVFTPPPAYQANLTLPASIANGPSGRGVPDIAMCATDYFVRVDSWEGKSGGTSAVAPLMASLVARLNQAKQKNLGFINPFLYANSGLFHDVISGTNGISHTVIGYNAGPGWNACTGLGTPDGVQLLNRL
jgi:kumamolisin